MDRFAVFVDAGYLYAEGGKLRGLGPSRSNIQLDGPSACQLLAELASESCGLPLLRIYWYDGARDGIPTSEQQRIAVLPNVKLRLGRLNMRNQQKGVDALIYRDLMTLARERAISDAFLVAGDDDLREGVKGAQDLGVRVVLLGVAASDGKWNQSRELVFEADERIELTKAHLSQFMDRRQIVDRSSEHGGSPEFTAEAAAEKFAERWLDGATGEELASLLAGKPRIPKYLDSDLLSEVEGRLRRSLRRAEESRQNVRRSFWQRIEQGAQQRAE